MNRYEKYKSSGIDWIGEIPEHWSLATVGRVTNIGRGRVISNVEISENEGEYPVYSSQTENNGVMGYLNTFDFDGEYVTWTTDGANAGTVFYRKGKFNCTNVCGTIQPKNWERIDLRFLPYFLNLGTRYSVRLDINPKLMNNMMAKIPFVIPTKKEQKIIANFLDEKTAQIDKLISNKQKLIELLKEERIAVIDEAVKKGINPKEKLKPSDVEWIGAIPQHWMIRRVSTFGKFFKGRGIKKDETKDVGLPCIRYGEIYTKYDRIVYNPTSCIDEETSKNSELIKKGDVLFAGSGETVEDIGKAIVYFGENNAYAGGDTIVLRLHDGIEPIYASYLMNASFFQHQKSLSGKGEIIVHIYPKNIREIIAPLPSKEEQIQIVKYLDKHTEENDSAISKVEKEIELMNEYRTALISEVVTGKFKVI